MASFHDGHSTMLIDDVSRLNNQSFSSRLNDQDMELTVQPKVEPVSDNEAESSSSELKKQKPPFLCTVCSKSFSRKGNLKQHLMIHSEERPFECDICQKAFSRKAILNRHKLSHLKIPSQHKYDSCGEAFSKKYDLLKHMKIHKSSKKDKCMQCNEIFNHKSDFFYHLKTSHRVRSKIDNSSSLKDMFFEKVKHFKRQNALNIFTKTVVNCNKENATDFNTFLNSIQSDVLNELNYQFQVKKSMKWYASVQVVVYRITQEGVLETATPYFLSKTILELTNQNLSEHVEDTFAKIIKSYEKSTRRGFNWTLDKILNLELSTFKI